MSGWNNILAIVTIFKFLVSKLDKEDCSELNNELKNSLKRINEKLRFATNANTIIGLAVDFSQILSSFLSKNSLDKRTIQLYHLVTHQMM